MKMSLVNKEAFSKAFERRYTTVEIPTLGTVRIVNMNERERTQQLAWARDKKGKPLPERVQQMDLRYIVDCVVDEHGNRIFTPEDMPQLQELDWGVKVKLMNAILKHCGLIDVDIEDIAKNSEATDA
jgi:hypothetical protein